MTYTHEPHQENPFPATVGGGQADALAEVERRIDDTVVRLGHVHPGLIPVSTVRRILAEVRAATTEATHLAGCVQGALIWHCAPDCPRRFVAATTETPPAPSLADVWDEAAEATADWMARNPSPAGIPHDPPPNPYGATETPPAPCKACHGDGKRIHGWAICPGPCQDCDGTGTTPPGVCELAANHTAPGARDTGEGETPEQAAQRCYNHGGYHGSQAATEDAMRAFINGAKWAEGRTGEGDREAHVPRCNALCVGNDHYLGEDGDELATMLAESRSHRRNGTGCNSCAVNVETLIARLAAGFRRPATGDTLTDTEREAEVVDRMATVFGWQHLARYSGQTSEWLNLTLGAMARAAMHADRRATEGHAAAIRRDQDERMVQALTETTAERNEARATEADLRARVEALADEFGRRQARNAAHNGGVSCSVWGLAGAELARLAALTTETQP